MKAYHQIEITAAEQEKTVVIPFRLYEYRMIPFGLIGTRNDFFFAYIDDILNFSKSNAEHEDHLERV